METKNINLFVFDTKENFEKSKDIIGEEGSTFKKIICVENAKDFESQIGSLVDNELFFLVVHVFSENISGIKKFVSSGIQQKGSQLEPMYISDGDTKKIKHLMVDNDLPNAEIYKYHQVQSNLADGSAKPTTKARFQSGVKDGEYPNVDYCVITALYKDEFEELKKIFDFPETEIIKAGTKLFHVGYLKSNKEKKVIAAIPNATGMVDSSIVATLMLELFKPKYLLMSGVCGGSEDTDLGDIVIAKQIFTFQKGKLYDIKSKSEDGTIKHIDLYDAEGQIIDYEHLYDEAGDQIAISIEKFEKEIDALINLNFAFEDALVPKLADITASINQSIQRDHLFKDKQITIHLEPMACSTMVINKEGYFADTIKSVHRKTAAVEMESYGIARACQYANEGKTIPLIFKSVMDKTSNKSDVVDGINFKKFAAYTSAEFMKCLFELNII